MSVFPLCLCFPLAFVFLQGKPPKPAPAKANEAGSVEFALRPEKDKVYGFECTSDSKQTSSISGQSAEVKAHTSFELSIQALDSPAAGPVRFKVTYSRVSGDIVTPQGKTEYDSAKPGLEIPAAVAAEIQSRMLLAGKSLEVEVDRHGNLGKVEGYAKIFEGTELAKALEQQGSPLTDAAATDDLQLIFTRLPEGKLKQGSVWTWKSSEDFIGNRVRFETEGRVAKLRPKDAKLDYGAAPAVPGKDGQPVPPAAGDKPIGFTSENSKVTSATALGTSTVSLADGLPIAQAMERKVETSVPNPSGGADIMLSIELSVVTKRVDKPAKKK